MLNVKSNEVGQRLNDPDRFPFSTPDDIRFTFLRDLAHMFKEMDTYSASSNTRVMGLTSDTGNALHVTLLGICGLVPKLLDRGMKYVLTGQLQSDRLEAEFGIYRQQSGGNYNISVQQVINSLGMQRLKLSSKLDFDQSDAHLTNDCCKQNLNSEEIDCLDSCFESSSSIPDSEKSSLFHISGYIAFKEQSPSTTLDNELIEIRQSSEFTKLVSRGKLSYPSEDLFDLSLYLYAYYKAIPDKKCVNKLLTAFEKIYEYTGYYIENHQSVLRRFANCFGKAMVNKLTDEVKRKPKGIKNTKDIKRSRMSGQ